MQTGKVESRQKFYSKLSAHQSYALYPITIHSHESFRTVLTPFCSGAKAVRGWSIEKQFEALSFCSSNLYQYQFDYRQKKSNSLLVADGLLSLTTAVMRCKVNGGVFDLKYFLAFYHLLTSPTLASLAFGF